MRTHLRTRTDMVVSLTSISLLGLVCGSVAFGDIINRHTRPDVIYGEDDRRDIFNPENDTSMVELARSTAVLVQNFQVTADATQAGYSRLPNGTFGESFGLCTDEPFFSQPNPGFCSGFLVAPDIFVTAGHCITDADSCTETSVVFGFSYEEEATDPTLVNNDNVYRCKEVIHSEYQGSTQTDFAVVRLDRAVVGRTPLRFRRDESIPVGTGVTVIGHPSGLPTKISGGANVRSSEANLPFFVANLDTYGGNSGSAVFNTETGEVEGILVRGEADFTTDHTRSCTISNRCANEACRGEDVTRATEFARYVPAK